MNLTPNQFISKEGPRSLFLETLHTTQAIATLNAVTEDEPDQAVDIEDVFPCGEYRCDKFQPHLWKPGTCVTCFKTKNQPEKTDHPIKQRSERWERRYKEQWEMISEALLECPIIENAMVQQMVSPGGSPSMDTEIVIRVVLKDNFNTYKPDKAAKKRVADITPVLEPASTAARIKSCVYDAKQIYSLWQNTDFNQDRKKESDQIPKQLPTEIPPPIIAHVAHTEAPPAPQPVSPTQPKRQRRSDSTEEQDQPPILQRPPWDPRSHSRRPGLVRSATFGSEPKPDAPTVKPPSLLTPTMEALINRAPEDLGRILHLEKQLLEHEWELFNREQILAHRELDIAKRESHYISEMRKLYTIKELYLNSTRQNEAEMKKIQQKKLELESVHQRLEKSKETLLATTERLKAKKKEHWKREKDFENDDFASALALQRRLNELEQQENQKLMKSEKLIGLIERARKEPLMQHVAGFKFTSDEKGVLTPINSVDELDLDYPENDIFFYRDHFMKQPEIYAELEKARKWLSFDTKLTDVKGEDFYDHINLILQHDDDDVAIISIRKSCDNNRNILGITRTKLGDQPFILAMDSKSKGARKKENPGSYSTKEIISCFRKQFPIFQNCIIPVIDCKKECRAGFFPSTLLALDRTLKVQSYKFGLLYFDEKLDHYNPSIQFQTFLNFMGDRIKLKGWRGYKADLDVNRDKTGTHSYYTEWFGMDIMFHVAPLLTDDSRDRIIGNDIVWFVWIQDGVWNPTYLLSQVNHCQILLRPVPTEDGEVFTLRVGVASRIGVPATTPPTFDGDFGLTEELRDFLLKKAINLERAAWHCESTIRSQSKSLEDLLELTRKGQLKFIVKQYLTSAREF